MRRVAIVQFDDRPDQELGPLRVLISRNADYARMHGYHHAFARAPVRDVPPYWNKVYLVDKYLSEFEIVAWLDSDAVIHDLTMPIESLFATNEAFVFSNALPVWGFDFPFCAGVFFCKGQFGREIVREWGSLYPAHFWEKRGTQWLCKDSRWAGPAYEQGVFIDEIYPKYRSNPAFKQLSWKKLQNPYPLKDAFTLHFPVQFRVNCLLYHHYLAETLGFQIPLPMVPRASQPQTRA
jgi:hypothetical protein